MKQAWEILEKLSRDEDLHPLGKYILWAAQYHICNPEYMEHFFTDSTVII
jgi:hypothetical protein